MPVPIIAPLSRGTSGIAEFPIASQGDLKLAYRTVNDLTERNTIPEWLRLPFMSVYVISEGKEYTLGNDLTIAGQVWTEKTFGVPTNVVTEDEIFDVNGYIQPQLIQNIFLNSSYVVASEAAMLAVTSYTGNFFIRTDTSEVYIKLNNDNPADVGDFALANNPGSVISVNGQVGVVNITIANLLAVPQNLTDFNTAVTNSPTVLDHSSTLATLTSDLNLVEADLSSLEAYVNTNLGTKLLSATAQNPTIAQNGYVIKWDNTLNQYVLAEDVTVGDGTFLGLLDTPSSYIGQANKFVRVKNDETGLEFVVGGGGGGHIIQDAGTPLTTRSYLNILNGLTASDDAGNDATLVKLGGVLTEDTTIGGNLGAFALHLGDLTTPIEYPAWYLRFPSIRLVEGGSFYIDGGSVSFFTPSTDTSSQITLQTNNKTEIRMVENSSTYGTNGIDRRLSVGSGGINATQFYNTTSSTNTLKRSIYNSLTAQLIGTGAGLGIDFYIGQAISNTGVVASIDYILTDSTAGSHDSKFVISPLVNHVKTAIAELDLYGWRYMSDYSANYTDRSLVDRGYVLSLTGGTALTFSNGLTNTAGAVKLGGALTGNTNITLTDQYMLWSQNTTGGIVSELGLTATGTFTTFVRKTSTDTQAAFQLSDGTYPIAIMSASNLTEEVDTTFYINSQNGDAILGSSYTAPSSKFNIQMPRAYAGHTTPISTVGFYTSASPTPGTGLAVVFNEDNFSVQQFTAGYILSLGNTGLTFTDGVVDFVTITDTTTTLRNAANNQAIVISSENTTLYGGTAASQPIFDVYSSPPDDRGISAYVANGVYNVGFDLYANATDATFTVTGNPTYFNGVEYSADFSANYTSRSLIDKGYADATYATIGGGSFLSSATNSTQDGYFTGVRLLETAGATFYTRLVNGSDLTANRTFTIAGGDGDRTLTLAGNFTTTGAFNTTFAFSGSNTITFPNAAITVARTDAAQTFTGVQTMTSPSITTSITTTTVSPFNLLNTTVTNIQAFQAATTINIGATSGAIIQLNPETVVGSNATQTLWNTTATTVNFAGAATSFNLGGTPTTALTANLFTNATANTVTKTINLGTAGVSGSITNINIGSAVSGATGTTIIGGSTFRLLNTPATDASFSTSQLLVRDSTGNVDVIAASGGGTTNFLRADGTWAAAGGGSGHIIENAGTPLTTRANLNVSNGLTASDNDPDTDLKWGGALTGVTTITSNARNQLSFDGTWTATASEDYHTQFGATITGSATISDFINGYKFNPTITANANSQYLRGVYINPTLATGGFVNIDEVSLEVTGTSAFGNGFTNASFGTNQATVYIKAPGDLSTDVGLQVINGSSVTVFYTTGLGRTYFGGSSFIGPAAGSALTLGGSGLYYYTSEADGYGHYLGNSGASVTTVGTKSHFFINGATWQPSSGTAERRLFGMIATHTQSGTAVGKVIMSDIRPTYNITAAPDANSMLIGYHYIPTNTALNGWAHYAFRATSGSMLLGESGSDTITASTKLDVRGVGTTTGKALRIADSANTERAYIQDSGAGVLGIGGDIGIGQTPSYKLDVFGTFRAASSTTVIQLTTGLININSTQYSVSQLVQAGGTLTTGYNYSGGAHTNLTASIEAVDITYNLARTVQFATGAHAQQRAFRVLAPTYAFVGASTLDKGVTLSISGSPIAGTNATITESYAIDVESGMIRLGAITQDDALTEVLVRDTSTGAVKYRSAASLGGGSGWATTGTTTLTGAVTIAQATNDISFLNGDILIGNTGNTITANTKVDIRGTGTTTNAALRVADSGDAEKFKVLDNGETYFSQLVGGSNTGITTSDVVYIRKNIAGNTGINIINEEVSVGQAQLLLTGRGSRTAKISMQTNMEIGTTSTYSVNIIANSATKMTVTSDGVGINTVVPTASYQLDVNGISYLRGGMVSISTTSSPSPGSITFIDDNRTWNPTGTGTGNLQSIDIRPIINANINWTGGIYGIIYNPTLTDIGGSTTHYAIVTGSGLHGFGTLTPTANTRVDIRGTGTTTGSIIRLADSANSERFKVLDNGEISGTLINVSSTKVVLGASTVFSGANALAIGISAQVTNTDGISIGSLAGATSGIHGSNQISIGRNANQGTTDIGQSSVGIGDSVVTSLASTIAIGNIAWAKGTGVISIGHQAANTSGTVGNYAISLGYDANQGTHNIGADSIAIGRLTKAVTQYSIAIGYNATIDATGDSTIAIGSNTSAVGGGVAIGRSAISTDGVSVALGNSSKTGAAGIAIGFRAGNTSGTYGGDQIAIGVDANQGTHNIGNRSIAIGVTSKSIGAYSIAITGQNSTASANGAIIMGYGTTTLTNSTADSFGLGWGASTTPDILFAKSATSYFNSTSGIVFGSASITASTKFDIRGIGTTTGNTLRLANSADASRFRFTDAGIMYIDVAPANDDALTQVLVRDGSTGEVKYRTASSLGGGGISDGDKGDITVSSSGAVWTVDETAISGKTAITSVDTASDYLLIWDATDSLLKKVLPSNLGLGGSYTFSNGITETGGAAKLGGALTENTSITGDNFSFSVKSFSTGSVNPASELSTTATQALLKHTFDANEYAQAYAYNASSNAYVELFGYDGTNSVYIGVGSNMSAYAGGPVVSFGGIQYIADYSGNYTSRSLVDQGYVTSYVTTTALSFTTGIKTFRDGILALRNPANTFSYTIRTSAIVAARDLTIPLLTANDVFVCEAHSQTLTNKTLGSGTAWTVAPTITDGLRITFNPDGTNAGLNVGSQAGDPSSLINGDIWYNSTSNRVKVRANGISHEIGTNSLPSKTITLYNPGATENITLFYTDVAITITKLIDAAQGTTPSVTYQINHATTRNNGTPNTLLTASRTLTSSSGTSTTTFNDATIPAGSWVWLTTSAASGTITDVAITLHYTED